MNYEQRKERFEEGLINLIKEYEVDLYPALIATQTGDVVNIIKIRDLKKEGQVGDSKGSPIVDGELVNEKNEDIVKS